MAVTLDVIVFHPAYNMNEVVESEACSRLTGSFQNDLNVVGTIEAFARMHAVIAHAAVLFRVLLTEIVQQLSSSANGRLCIVLHFLEQYPGVLSFLHRFVFVEFLQLVQIVMAVEHKTYPFQAVTP